MYIGEFAKLTGTTPKTIRFYESIGLIPKPLRKGNYRIYDKTYVETVIQIKMAQNFGFKLSEIKQEMEGENIERGMPASVIVNAIKTKREQIKTELNNLNSLDQQLVALQKELEISQCNVDSTL